MIGTIRIILGHLIPFLEESGVEASLLETVKPY